jgi:hypothetical protein
VVVRPAAGIPHYATFGWPPRRWLVREHVTEVFTLSFHVAQSLDIVLCETP